MDAKKLAEGDIISKIIYAKVTKLDIKFTGFHAAQLVAECTDLDDGTQFWMEGEELIGTCLSTDVYESTIKLPLTELATTFTKVGTRPFTVGFIKQDGTERLLRGRMVRPDNVLGQSLVQDLDIQSIGQNPLRTVDHRSIKFLIVSNTFYGLSSPKKG